MPKFIKTFDTVPKKRFDPVPNLTKTYDLVVRSSAIRSSDHFPLNVPREIYNCNFLRTKTSLKSGVRLK